MPDAPGYEAWAEYIKDEYEAEDARKNSIEQRGIAVITTSGALVTLVFGLVAVVIGAEHIRLPEEAHTPLYIALGFFIGAVLSAIGTNLPRGFERVKPNALIEVVNGAMWDEPPSDAHRNVAATRVDELRSAQRLNQQKAQLLILALSLEVLAICAVAAAVILTLANPPRPM